MKHLIEDAEGNFNPALKWVVQSRDTELVCHPSLKLVCDTIWDGLAFRLFLLDQSIYLCFLLIFVTGQSFLQHVKGARGDGALRTVTFVCRLIVYLGSIPQLLLWQLRRARRSIREGDMMGPVLGWRCPSYLRSLQAILKLGLLLCLLLMCVLDPVLWCLGDSGDYEGSGLFTQSCPRAMTFRKVYSALSMFATLFYWLILSNLSVLSMRVLAFCLLCGKLAGELGLFLMSVSFLIPGLGELPVLFIFLALLISSKA